MSACAGVLFRSFLDLRVVIQIPPQYAPNLAVIVGFGLNTQTGQNVAELYTYSNVTSTVVRTFIPRARMASLPRKLFS